MKSKLDAFKIAMASGIKGSLAMQQKRISFTVRYWVRLEARILKLIKIRIT